MLAVVRESFIADAACATNQVASSLLDSWKWRPVLVVAVQCARAHRALPVAAARDLVGKPVQAIRGVGDEFPERSQLSDLRWKSNECAAVELQALQ